LLSAYYAFLGDFKWALIHWTVNRISDGLDGTIARIHNLQTDTGGYLDILLDFAVYSVIPIGITFSRFRQQTEVGYFVLSVLLGIYFVNCASLFQLAAIMEKRKQIMKENRNKTLTSVEMPDANGTALVEGFETMLAYTLFILFPEYSTAAFSIFGALVFVTICQRLIWAFKNL